MERGNEVNLIHTVRISRLGMSSDDGLGIVGAQVDRYLVAYLDCFISSYLIVLVCPIRQVDLFIRRYLQVMTVILSCKNKNARIHATSQREQSTIDSIAKSSSSRHVNCWKEYQSDRARSPCMYIHTVTLKVSEHSLGGTVPHRHLYSFPIPPSERPNAFVIALLNAVNTEAETIHTDKT